MSDALFYQLIPIRESFVKRARSQGLDDQDQQVERLIAEGGEPCRDVLRRARPGEELILASYCPFEQASPYKEYGPVFILANEDKDNVYPRNFPVENEGAYFGNQFVLRAYSSNERIVDACLSSPENYLGDLQTLLSNAAVSFVLARFAAYGCYGCRIEKSS